MKRLILFILLCLILACSKDENKIADSDCGAIIGLDQRRPDGGVQEMSPAVYCGENWKYFEDLQIASSLKIKKGDTRPLATYLVATKSDTVYIRYKSGNVPQSTIDSFVNIGYATNIQTLTGLERINWP